MSDYPEHDKLQSVREESQTIGEFLDTCGYVLCEVKSGLSEDRYMPVRNSITDILAHYFCIDLDRIEAEKRAMLEGLRGPKLEVNQ